MRSAWKLGKEAALAPDGWYPRSSISNGKKEWVVIAMNGGYPQTETPGMANLIFYQIIPVIFDELR